MFGERLRAMLGDAGVSRRTTTPERVRVAERPSATRIEQVYCRPSHALAQFFSATNELRGFPMLDLAGASQANISFITEMGFRLYSDDTMRVLEMAFGAGPDYLENQSDPAKVDQFMSSTLDYPDTHFCGALLWDSLQFLTPPLLQDTVDQLYRILMPGAYMFAVFHANERCPEVPRYSYRIADAKSLVVSARNETRPAHFFNNRTIEKLFHRYHYVKFFLTRDNLREIIVRR
jgi:hypothetical protein